MSPSALATKEAARSPHRRRERPDPERRTVQRRQIDGTVISEVVLDPQIFGIEPNVAVLHQVVTAQRSAGRAGTHSTRSRAQVSGGGAKPFRQKGTGRARQGSTRSPQWSGGGVAHGPKPRAYEQRTPKKMIRLALYSALSDRVSEQRVAVVDDWSFDEPRTKDAVSALGALGLEGRVLVVLGPDDGIADRSFANLPRVQSIQLGELNAYDVIRSDWVVFTDATLPGETEPVEQSKPASQARSSRATKATQKATKSRAPAAEVEETDVPQNDAAEETAPEGDET